MSDVVGYSQLAQLGFAALGANDGSSASAAQLAIWSLEYNVLPTFYNGVVQSDFQPLLGDVIVNNGCYAPALIPDSC